MSAIVPCRTTAHHITVQVRERATSINVNVMAEPVDRERKKQVPTSPSAGSSGLTSLSSTADISAYPDFEPSFEACYSIALENDRSEPSAKSVELFSAKTRISPAAAIAARSPKGRARGAGVGLNLPTPPKAASGSSGGPNSPRYMMTPRSSARFDLSKAFSLAHPGVDSQDEVDDIFGNSEHEDRWDLTVIGFFTGLLINLLALFGCFLIKSTGRKRTFFSWGVLAGTFVQCVGIAVYIIEYHPGK